MSGWWSGKVTADMPALLASAKNDRNRRLLIYTMKRLEKAEVAIHMRPDHTFTYSFDDGYAMDRRTVNGKWVVEGKELVITTGQKGKPMRAKLQNPPSFRISFFGDEHVWESYKKV